MKHWLAWISLWRLGWPQTQRSAWMCLWNTQIKGILPCLALPTHVTLQLRGYFWIAYFIWLFISYQLHDLDLAYIYPFSLTQAPCPLCHSFPKLCSTSTSLLLLSFPTRLFSTHSSLSLFFCESFSWSLWTLGISCHFTTRHNPVSMTLWFFFDCWALWIGGAMAAWLVWSQTYWQRLANTCLKNNVLDQNLLQV